MQPLKRIRAGARLKRAAAQQRCARRFDRLGDRDHLLFALHGARAGDNLEQAVSDGHAAAIHHRILRMELAVCFLVGFLNAADSLHCIQRGNEVGVHARRVAHQPQNGAVFAFRFVDAQPHAKEKLFQSVNLFLPCFVLQDDNHGVSSILPDIIVHYNLKQRKRPAANVLASRALFSSPGEYAKSRPAFLMQRVIITNRETVHHGVPAPFVCSWHLS